MASEIHRPGLARIRQTHGSVYLGTHLETIPAYGRAEMHMEVLWTGIQGRSEAFDSFLQDSGYCPAPPCVEKADRSGFGIDQGNGNTVGNGDAQEKSGGPADVSVRIGTQNQVGPIGWTRTTR